MFAYCLKCKKQQEMKNPQMKTTKNGRSMMSGECIKCSCKMNKFVKG